MSRIGRDFPDIILPRRTFLGGAASLAAALLMAPGRTLAECAPTSSDVMGPFHALGSPIRTTLCSSDEPGTRMLISGRVLGPDCQPLANAAVDVWHATDAGCYSVYEDCDDKDKFNCRGIVLTGANGEYTYETILPGHYGGRPRHVHYLVVPEGGDPLVTQLYFRSDPRSEHYPDDLVIPLDDVDGRLQGNFDVVLS